MLFVGLTGSIATGKSTVADMFEKLGCYVIDADKLAHKVYEKGEEAYFQVIDEFGKSILDNYGNIDRKELGKIVLNNKEKLNRLEAIVHPAIERLRNKEIKKILKKCKNPIIIYDVPLLFEKNLQDMFDYTVVVYADKKTEIQRLMNREKLNEDEAKTRISLQIPIEQKARMADFIIDNSGSMKKTHFQVKEVFNKLKKLNNERG